MNVDYAKQLKDKNILVVGLGKSGKAAVSELIDIGATICVQDTKGPESVDDKFLGFMDRSGVKTYLGCEPDDITRFDMLVLSPGVPLDLGFIADAKRAGAEVIGEIELAYRLSEGKFVAITGTNGKTTTTTLVGEIFRASRRTTEIVGNIGVAAITSAVAAERDAWLITEVSSFQLESVTDFCPDISAILNLTPDHLNRHKTMDAYAEAKAKVFANQNESDHLIVNGDDELCMAMAKNSRAAVSSFSIKNIPKNGAFLDGDELCIADRGETYRICSRSDLKIIGDHNVENVLAAALICYCAGIDIETISRTVLEFPGVEHRLEYCGSVDGVKFYNDSKGTNVDAALIAIRALESDIVLIAGGDGKGQDFDGFGKSLTGKVKALVLLGRDADLIEEAARQSGYDDIYMEKDMNACVRRAMEISNEGDKVLLSPACASWDMYDNYEQRGRHFKECVEQLTK